MNNVFQNPNYEFVVRKIIKYLNFDDVRKMRELHILYNEIKYFTYEEAIKDKNYANVEYLTYHIPFTINDTSLDHIMAYAARFGNRMIMEVLYINGCWLSADTFKWAAEIGNLNDMKWLKKIGCRLDTWTFSSAIINGNLENMKWLMEVGCPICAGCFNTAVYVGNLENMRWLLDNGCPYEKDIIYDAEIYAKPYVITWLKENIK